MAVRLYIVGYCDKIKILSLTNESFFSLARQGLSVKNDNEKMNAWNSYVTNNYNFNQFNYNSVDNTSSTFSSQDFKFSNNSYTFSQVRSGNLKNCFGVPFDPGCVALYSDNECKPYNQDYKPFQPSWGSVAASNFNNNEDWLQYNNFLKLSSLHDQSLENIQASSDRLNNNGFKNSRPYPSNPRNYFRYTSPAQRNSLHENRRYQPYTTCYPDTYCSSSNQKSFANMTYGSAYDRRDEPPHLSLQQLNYQPTNAGCGFPNSSFNIESQNLLPIQFQQIKSSSSPDLLSSSNVSTNNQVINQFLLFKFRS